MSTEKPPLTKSAWPLVAASAFCCMTRNSMAYAKYALPMMKLQAEGDKRGKIGAETVRAPGSREVRDGAGTQQSR